MPRTNLVWNSCVWAGFVMEYSEGDGAHRSRCFCSHIPFIPPHTCEWGTGKSVFLKSSDPLKKAKLCFFIEGFPN